MYAKHMLALFGTVLLLSSFSLPLLLDEVYAQTFTANINQRSYAARDTLVVFGKSVPNDSLIAEFFNPQGKLILRTQIDAGVEGSFSRILMEWPTIPDEKFSFGVYTLKLTSSLTKEEKFLVLRFSDVPTAGAVGERRLELNVSVPQVIGKEETAKIIVEVSVNGVLVKGSTDETLKGSRIYYPDGSIVQIDNFVAIDDGIYLSDFSSDTVGHHVIHIQAFYQGLLANTANGIFVEEGTILSLGKEIGRVNENLEKLRAETIERNLELAKAVENVSLAAGQVTSLLLPVIGMIVVVVVLQATILSRRGKPNNH
jgi:hypothetical protein